MKIFAVTIIGAMALGLTSQSLATKQFDPSKEAKGFCKGLKAKRCEVFTFYEGNTGAYGVVISKKKVSTADAIKALSKLKTPYKYPTCFASIDKSSSLCILSKHRPPKNK